MFCFGDWRLDFLGGVVQVIGGFVIGFILSYYIYHGNKAKEKK